MHPEIGKFGRWLQKLASRGVETSLIVLGIVGEAIRFFLPAWDLPLWFVRGLWIVGFLLASYGLYREVGGDVDVAVGFEGGWISPIGLTEDNRFVRLHARLQIELSNKSERSATCRITGIKSIGGYNEPECERIHVTRAGAGMAATGPIHVMNVGPGEIVPVVVEAVFRVPNQAQLLNPWGERVAGELSYRHTFGPSELSVPFEVPIQP